MDVVFSLVIATCLYLLYRVWWTVFVIFREYFVLWNVAVGAREDRRNVSARVRLHAYVCKTALLDEVSVNELYRFLVSMIDTEIDIHQFHQILLSYKFAITCRERKDGSLRGVSLLDVIPAERSRQDYTLIRIGLSFFENFYRGGPLLYYIIFYHIFIQLLCHPLTPVYIIGKCFSYKSYLAVIHNMTEVYPRYDAPTPPSIKSIIDSYAESIKFANEEYDRETCVLKRELSSIKETVAPIFDNDLKNPHIQFFTSQNPGWHKGHQLIIVAKTSWFDLFRGVWRAIQRNRNGRSGGGRGQERAKPKQESVKHLLKYTRQFSFQCETTSRFATAFSEMDIGGHHEERDSPVITYSTQNSFDLYDHLQF